MRPARPRGFTLIEVAAALAIGAGALSVLLAAFVDGGRGVDRAGAQRLAVMVAQSALAAAGTEGPLAPGARWAGGAHGLAWLVEVEPWGEARAATGRGPALPEPLLVQVTVAAGADGSGPVLARLATIRLSDPPPPPAPGRPR